MQVALFDNTPSRTRRNKPTAAERDRCAAEALMRFKQALARGDDPVGSIDAARYLLHEPLTDRQLYRLEDSGALEVTHQKTPEKVHESGFLWSVHIARPRAATFELFEDFRVKHAATYMEIPNDRDADNRRDRDAIVAAYRHHLVLRYDRPTPWFAFRRGTSETWYGADRDDPRNCTIYTPRSKLTDRMCVRAEPRVTGKLTVADRLHLGTVHDLTPRKLERACQKLFQLYAIADREAINRGVQQMIRSEVAEEVHEIRRFRRMRVHNRAVEKLEAEVAEGCRAAMASMLFNEAPDDALMLLEAFEWADAPISSLLTFARAVTRAHIRELENGAVLRRISWHGLPRLREPS